MPLYRNNRRYTSLGEKIVTVLGVMMFVLMVIVALIVYKAIF
jgi:hypothetical protein